MINYEAESFISLFMYKLSNKVKVFKFVTSCFSKIYFNVKEARQDITLKVKFGECPKLQVLGVSGCESLDALFNLVYVMYSSKNQGLVEIINSYYANITGSEQTSLQLHKE